MPVWDFAHAAATAGKERAVMQRVCPDGENSRCKAIFLCRAWALARDRAWRPCGMRAKRTRFALLCRQRGNAGGFRQARGRGRSACVKDGRPFTQGVGHFPARIRYGGQQEKRGRCLAVWQEGVLFCRRESSGQGELAYRLPRPSSSRKRAEEGMRRLTGKRIPSAATIGRCGGRMGSRGHAGGTCPAGRGTPLRQPPKRPASAGKPAGWRKAGGCAARRRNTRVPS